MGSINDTVMKNQTGFTIIEMVVVIGIFSLISAGLIGLVSGVFLQGSKLGTSLADSDQSRRLGLKITQELRNAVYGHTGGYPLNTAGDQQIIFYSNVDNDSDIERVRYYYQNGSVFKGVVDPTGSPLTYNTANEVVTNVQSNVANSTTPLFYYYNENYDGANGAALTQPVNVTQVTFVKLNLMVYNKAASAGKYYTVTNGASIRNIKTNLGD